MRVDWLELPLMPHERVMDMLDMLDISEREGGEEKERERERARLCGRVVVRAWPPKTFWLHDKEAIGGMDNDLTKQPAGNII